MNYWWRRNDKLFMFNSTATNGAYNTTGEDTTKLEATGGTERWRRAMQTDNGMSHGRATLTDILEKREVRLGLIEAINLKLAFSSEAEQLEVEALSNRALDHKCGFDRKHRLMIYALALAPDQVSWSFKLRERIHRLLHQH
jgi:hypothetical protein